jgi:hypothetical protein
MDDNQWHLHDIMGAIIMELHSKWVVLIELQLSCNCVTHVICPLALMAYKYNELQMSFATQKLSCKANWKTPFFFIMNFS